MIVDVQGVMALAFLIRRLLMSASRWGSNAPTTDALASGIM